MSHCMGPLVREVSAHAFELASRFGAARGAHVCAAVDRDRPVKRRLPRNGPLQARLPQRGQGLLQGHDPERAACRKNFLKMLQEKKR